MSLNGLKKAALCAGLVAVCGVALHAQEPAMANGMRAVRFAEAPGFFHYIVPCGMPGDSGAQVNALCWPVQMTQVELVGGKVSEGTIVAGLLRISETKVDLLPDDPSQSSLAHTFTRRETQMTHNDGSQSAFLGSETLSYEFGLTSMCMECAAGSHPLDPSKTAQLNQEFALVNEAIKDYDAVSKRIYDMAESLPDPTKIPRDIKVMHEDAAPAAASAPGVAGMNGMMGGPAGGVYGGSTGGSTPGPTIVVARPRPSGPARLSGGVMEGNILNRTTPVYPAVARATHVSGAVVLHAVISKRGTIESLSVVSGPPMLQGAALDAVKTWTYKPYLLNGEPTEVDTTITVNFNLAKFDGVAPAASQTP